MPYSTLFRIIFYSSLLTIFSGCMSTSLKSMATQPISTIHQPRQNPLSKESELNFSLDGFAIRNSSWFNTSKINAGGGILGFHYRLGKQLSPLFLGGFLGTFAGSVQFDCDKKSHCSNTYQIWQKSDEGQDNYSFLSLTEQIVAGTEFDLPANIFVGFDGGMKLYQGKGGYDDKRQYLEDNIPSIKNSDDGYGIAPLMDFWLGYRIGDKGKYGALSLQGSWSTLYRDDLEIRIPVSFAYFHSSGFHGGISWTGNTNFVFSLGKTFSF